MTWATVSCLQTKIPLIVWQQTTNPLHPAEVTDTVSNGSTWVSQCPFGILSLCIVSWIFKWAEYSTVLELVVGWRWTSLALLWRILKHELIWEAVSWAVSYHLIHRLIPSKRRRRQLLKVIAICLCGCWKVPSIGCGIHWFWFFIHEDAAAEAGEETWPLSQSTSGADAERDTQSLLPRP